MSTPLATSTEVNTYGSTANSGASIESQPSVSEEEEADDSSSLELGGRAAREVRSLGEALVVL